jgi:hypothetical protein
MVLGRYGVHFHHCMAGSRGSTVTGCVARDMGSHAYVPHMSDGITFTDCISHNTVSPAYWWDAMESSNDIMYDRCVASRVDEHTEFGHANCGFQHGSGTGLHTQGCVAVSVYGGDAAGYFWNAGENGVWDWHDNTAHTNNDYGIRTWQNNGQRHVVTNATIFNNYAEGIKHGAYGNSYEYIGGSVVGNTGRLDKSTQISVSAVSISDDPSRSQTFRNIYIDAAGTGSCMELPDGSQVPPSGNIQVSGCTFKGATKRSLGMYHHGDPRYTPNVIQVSSCTFNGTVPRTVVEPNCNRGAGFNVR